VLNHAANRKSRLSALPNVGPYIYDVKISGFTRRSIYIYDIRRLRVKSTQIMDTSSSELEYPPLSSSLSLSLSLRFK
jgi:hypothetical protein